MEETVGASNTCVKCGCGMVETTAPFLDDDYLPIFDIGRLVCPECGAWRLADGQGERYDEAARDGARRRFLRRYETERPELEEKPWPVPKDAGGFDELFEWVGGGARAVRLLGDDGEGRVVLFNHEAYSKLQDYLLPAPEMELWELRGFCFQDMPTLQDVFRATDEGGLMSVVTEILEADLGTWPWRGIAMREARDWLHRFLGRLRETPTASCDEDPVVVLPYRAVAPTRVSAVSSVRWKAGAFGMSATDVDVSGEPFFPDDADLEVALGWKAWFGGCRLHDMYEAIARVFLVLAERERALPGWLAAKVGDGRSEAAPGCAEGDWFAGEPSDSHKHDLEERAADLAGRLVPIDDLVTVSFEVDADVLAKFEVIARSRGLSAQNALHLALQKELDRWRDDGLATTRAPSLRD